MTTIKLKVIHKNAVLPKRGTELAACFDVSTIEDFELLPGIPRKVRTGIEYEVPAGYMLEIRPRSGLATTGITVANTPGTLDADFRGELCVILVQLSSFPRFNGTARFSVGDRVAQVRLVKLEETRFEVVDTLSETVRGTKGYGSTGLKAI